MDKRSADNIDKLHPKLRAKSSELWQAWKDAGEELTIVTSLRTPLEQNDLYAQGRTKAGKIVTQAKAWDSMHNYGLAIDCYNAADLRKGKLTAPSNKAGAVAEKLGWVWGGRWKKPYDPPHFQFTGKYKLIDLKVMRKDLDAKGYLENLDL
jgi:peptidoglycan L-alanyl-D-glutamate endopeptidase CwlK